VRNLTDQLSVSADTGCPISAKFRVSAPLLVATGIFFRVVHTL